ncbi:DUF5610 domain-containing protein [Dasania marina]|uniref:DUF5610 domain-containing protein n=1 Tax=Dasania marina TaxID=471499 RepID=UPI00036DFD7B|nr:DUF5610 domain-containing protein [Dasania marina]
MAPPNVTDSYSSRGLQKPALPEQASERASEARSKPHPHGMPPGLAKKIDSGELDDPKASLNQAIIESQLSVSVGAKDQPMALLFKTVLEALKEYVDPILGTNAIEEAYESGLDVSPEATAERIVSQSTAFFSAFQSQERNQDLSLQEQVDKFLEVIGGGIDQGFKEARDILGGLGVLEGDIASNIDKTYELVQQGLKDFAAGQQSQL